MLNARVPDVFIKLRAKCLRKICKVQSCSLRFRDLPPLVVDSGLCSYMLRNQSSTTTSASKGKHLCIVTTGTL